MYWALSRCDCYTSSGLLPTVLSPRTHMCKTWWQRHCHCMKHGIILTQQNSVTFQKTWIFNMFQNISNKLSRCATRKIRMRHIYNKSWPHPSKSLHMATCSLVILIMIISINIKTKKHNFEVRYPVVLSYSYHVSNNHMIACCTKWYIHSCVHCSFTK